MYIHQGEHVYQDYNEVDDHLTLLLTLPLFVVGITALACCCGGSKVAPQANNDAPENEQDADDDYEYEENYPNKIETPGEDQPEQQAPEVEPALNDAVSQQKEPGPPEAEEPEDAEPAVEPAVEPATKAGEQAEEEPQEPAAIEEEEVWVKEEGEEQHPEDAPATETADADAEIPFTKTKVKAKTRRKKSKARSGLKSDQEAIEQPPAEIQQGEEDKLQQQEHDQVRKSIVAQPQPTDFTKVKVVHDAPSPKVVEPKVPTSDDILKAKQAYRLAQLGKEKNTIDDDQANFYAPMLAKK